MPRKPLLPGQTGTPTVRRISRNTNGKPITDPNGKEWEASIRIGQYTGKPKLIRRTGNTRQQALEHTLTAAQHHTTLALAPHLHHITLTLLWHEHLNSHQWHTLAPRTKETLTRTQRTAYNHSPLLWDTPTHETLHQRVWQHYLDQITTQHGTEYAQQIKRIILKITQPYTDILDTTPIQKTTIQTGHKVKQRPQTDKQRIFTPTELAELKHYLHEHRHTPHAKGQVIRGLLFNTFAGMRISEIGKLTWENFSPDHTTVTGYSTKTSRPYPKKTLPPWAIELVQEQNPHNPGPFPIPPNTYATHSRQILNQAGFTWATSHTIRRTVGSIIFDQYGARAAASWLAHTNISTTLAHYIKTDHDLTALTPNL